MGSSGEESNKGIDAAAGGLVWVRRRNGSWWPGKILGPEELPEGCVPTPRCGTPVKLLGREDASIDWYNLEKSKRVKAFHCGEYDDCIKKVKESASLLSKKGAIYARRKDAILHALELERARLGVDHPQLSSLQVPQNDESPSAPRLSEESEGLDETLDSSGDDIDSVSDSGEESKQNDSEDDGFKGVKRMRGLGDLGMGIASSIKQKRSEVAHVPEILKRKNRRRPLTKVMASATVVSAPEACDESNKNDSVVINNDSESNGVSFENGMLLDESTERQEQDNGISSEKGSSQELVDVPLVAEEQDSTGKIRFTKLHVLLDSCVDFASTGLSSVVSDASQLTHVAHSSQASHVEAAPLANDELNRSAPTSLVTANIHEVEQSTSQWRLKGKRNSRPRKVENEAETDGTGVDRELFLSAFGRSSDSKNNGPNNWSWNSLESHIPQRVLPYRQSRFTVNPKYDDSDHSLQQKNPDTGLFEVKVEVKTGYRSHHVPYISLMSKFTGRPIVGHPLTIEISEDSLVSEPSELDREQRPRRRTPASSRARSSSRLRKTATLSKKTRRLSSLTAASSQRQSRNKTKPVVEKLKGPSIACVPLKVVFSRINAALSSSVHRSSATSIV